MVECSLFLCPLLAQQCWCTGGGSGRLTSFLQPVVITPMKVDLDVMLCWRMPAQRVVVVVLVVVMLVVMDCGGLCKGHRVVVHAANAGQSRRRPANRKHHPKRSGQAEGQIIGCGHAHRYRYRPNKPEAGQRNQPTRSKAHTIHQRHTTQHTREGGPETNSVETGMSMLYTERLQQWVGWATAQQNVHPPNCEAVAANPVVAQGVGSVLC